MKPKTRDEVLSLRLDHELSKRLSGLAEATDRSRSFLAAEAIEAFVSAQEWQVEAIQEGLRQAKAGDFAPEGRVRSILKRAQGR